MTRQSLVDEWLHNISIVAGRVGLKHLGVTEVLGPRAAALEISSSGNGALLNALKKNDAALLRATIPDDWGLTDDPSVYFVGKLLRVEANWPEHLRQSITIEQIGTRPIGQHYWVVGLLESGATAVVDLRKTPHALVAGVTGSGKTNAILGAVTQLSEGGADIVLIDGKSGESFYRVENVSGVIAPSAKTEAQARDALRYVISVMNDRYARINTDNDFKRLVVVIDELQTFAQPLQAEIAEIVTKGRAANISVIMGTQHPSLENTGKTTRRNATLRVVFRVEDRHSSAAALGVSVPGAYNLTIPGDAYVRTPRGTYRVQVAQITDGFIKGVRKNGRKQLQWKDIAPEDTEFQHGKVKLTPNDLGCALYVVRAGKGRPTLEEMLGSGSSRARSLMRIARETNAVLEELERNEKERKVL